MHYGVKGMKWGIRKAHDRVNSLNRSLAYSKAEKKLKTIQAIGTLRGANLYKKDKDEAKFVAVYPFFTKTGRTGTKALNANAEVEIARRRKNKSILGRFGYGKTAKAYKTAQAKAHLANQAYYDALAEREYEKLKRKQLRSMKG